MHSTQSPYADPNVADGYARIAAPRQFAQPARDLVTFAQLSAGSRVLDIGTGTGEVGRAAMRVVGAHGHVIGIDASMAMLLTHQPRRYALVRAVIPGLPFKDQTFDAVLVGFVLSHFADVGAALRELQRVCRSGGRFAASAWGSRPNDPTKLWADIAGQFASRETTDREFRVFVPDEASFANSQSMRRVIENAGYLDVRTDTHEYRIEMPTRDFLAARAASVQGTLLRRLILPTEWNTFQQQLGSAFDRIFGERVSYVRDVHLVRARH